MKIEKYGFRNWAVYDNAGELVCVTVYKKGALEVVKRLENISSISPIPTHDTDDIKRLLNEIKLSSSKIKEITKQLNTQITNNVQTIKIGKELIICQEEKAK